MSIKYDIRSEYSSFLSNRISWCGNTSRWFGEKSLNRVTWYASRTDRFLAGCYQMKIQRGRTFRIWTMCAEAIHSWYWKESRSQSYQAPNWKISPERSVLFQQFRSDPNYHLKNLVEVVARNLVEEMLRSDGIDAKVMLTSDSDDVFSWVDLIIEVKTPEGNDTQELILLYRKVRSILQKKRNVRRRHVVNLMLINDMVIKQSLGKFLPFLQTMSWFLSIYMEKISSNGVWFDSGEVLSLFHEAKNNRAKVCESTQSRVQNVIH